MDSSEFARRAGEMAENFAKGAEIVAHANHWRTSDLLHEFSYHIDKIITNYEKAGD